MLYYPGEERPNRMSDPRVQAQAIIVQAQEEERYRLARLLHEGPAQLLANTAVEIESYLRLMDTQPQAARDGLQSLLRELQKGLGDVRELIAGLQPPLLAELGLVVGLQKYAETFTRQTGITVELSGWEQLTERLPATAELAIFRIIQEAVENIREHAQAQHAHVALDAQPDQLIITIADDGKGFTTSNTPQGRRLGFVAMRDRAELLGGNLQVFSDPGRGMRVVLTAPIPSRRGP